MKIRIDQASLASATAVAARAIGPRAAMPVLSAAHLQVEKAGRVTVTGFDYDTRFSVTVECFADEDGVVALPGRPLAQLVAALPDGAVTVTVDGGNAVIQGRGVRYRMPCVDVAQYPALPVPAEASLAVDAEALKNAATAAARASKTGAELAWVECLQLRFTPAGLSLLASDRYVIGYFTIPWAGALPDESLSTLEVDAADFTAVTKAMAGKVQIGVDGNTISVTDGHVLATLQRRDVPYPQVYEGFIATRPTFTTTATLDRADLADAASRAMQVMAGNKQPRIRLDITGDGVAYSATDGTYGDVDGDLNAALDGDPLTVTFNAAFLDNALKAFDSSQIRVDATKPTRPLYLTDPSAPDGVFVAVPIRA